MLVLRRNDGQWIEVTHRSGDVLRFRVYDVSGDQPGRVNLAFDDEARNFSIQRAERPDKTHPFPVPPTRPVGFVDGYLAAGVRPR